MTKKKPLIDVEKEFNQSLQRLAQTCGLTIEEVKARYNELLKRSGLKKEGKEE